MLRNLLTKPDLLVLSVLLLISVGLSALFYHRQHAYFLELQRTHLDPLGLRFYSTARSENASPPDKPAVVFFGDSRAQQWPMPRVSDMAFINRGVGGQTSAQALGRLPYDVLPLNPAIVVIQVGINDLKTIPSFPDRKAEIVAKCKEHIRQIVNSSAQNGAQVVVTTIFPLGQTPVVGGASGSREVEAAIDEVNRFIVSLAGNKVKVFDAAGILADGDGKTDSLYSKNRLHLSRTGYNELNQELVHILRTSLIWCWE